MLAALFIAVTVLIMVSSVKRYELTFSFGLEDENVRTLLNANAITLKGVYYDIPLCIRNVKGVVSIGEQVYHIDNVTFAGRVGDAGVLYVIRFVGLRDSEAISKDLVGSLNIIGDLARNSVVSATCSITFPIQPWDTRTFTLVPLK